MAPDDLCMYHCLCAAADLRSYVHSTANEKAASAAGLRTMTIRKLREKGLFRQADRLSQEGPDGYPDEEDFIYLSEASGVSFELDLGHAYKPHYGTSPISATLLYTDVVDGAGHSSKHYDLKQVYRHPFADGNGARRLRKKSAWLPIHPKINSTKCPVSLWRLLVLRLL